MIASRRERVERPGIGWGRFLPFAAFAAAAVLLGACATSPAKSVDGLEMVISTDGLSAPMDFDDIRLEVSEQSSGGAWNKLWDRDYVVPSAEATLPTTFTLRSGQTPEEVFIAVTAYRGGAYGQPVVQRVAQVQVPTDRLALLYLVLAKVCEGQVTVTGAEGEPMSRCMSGESCQPSTGMCGPNVISGMLPTYVPGQSFDAGVSSGDATASGEGDGGGDASSEAGTHDATTTGDASGDGSQAVGSASDSGGGDAVAACLSPQMECDGACVDLTSPANCGTCGNACATAVANAQPTCSAGGCSFSCKAGYSLCGGTCVQYTTAANCGSCGSACSGAASVCVGSGTSYSCAATCPSMAPTPCSGSCVDETSDANNCQTCGHACITSVANAQAVCVNSACAIACDAGYTLCSGACVQLTSAANCGSCGNACSGAAPACVGSGAAYSCAGGCPGATPTLCSGTCVGTTTDVNNCGTCGHACSTAVANATAACASSACSFTCKSGYSSCNGACVDFTTDGNNCGGCGSGFACSGSTPVCSGSMCVSGCPAATPMLCSGTCVDTTSNANHCGTCATTCSTSIANASAACVSSACSFTCNSGYSVCNGACIDFMTDGNNCGGCGSAHACTNQACVSGVCSGVCSPGATQCSGNGVQTCGSNGQWGTAVACSSSQMCAGGSCVATDAGTATPPSCAPGGPGMTNCGAASESCCTSLEVPSGTYYRTYTNSGDAGATGEADQAMVSGFRLDKYVVTVGRFRQFMDAVQPPDGGAGYLPPAGSGKHAHLNGGQGLANSASAGAYEPGWVASDDGNVAPGGGGYPASCTAGSSLYTTWTDATGSNENLPINCVRWQQAYAFCIWDGGFLPSEAEWEYAAAGGSQQREYPWGTTDPGAGYQYAIYDCNYPSGKLNASGCTGVSNIAPVGTATMSAGFWGQLDMVGNMGQMSLDWYANYVACTDCAYLTAASYRVVHGGYYSGGDLSPASRYTQTPTVRQATGGFRCARTP